MWFIGRAAAAASARAVLATAAILAAAAPLSVPALAAQPGHPRGRCDRHHALRRTQSLVVFVAWTHRTDEIGARIANVEVCARPSGRAVRLTTATGYSGYPPNQDLQELRLAGDYAGALVVVGEASQFACQMVQNDCPVPFARLSFVNARARRAGTLVPPGGQAQHLTLSPAGAAAWLAPASPGPAALMAGRLVAQGRHGLTLTPMQLDSGTIADLHWDGLTLTWTNSGQPHTARVG